MPRRVVRTLWIPFVLIFVLPQFLSPALFRTHDGGQFSSCCSNEKNIGTALEMYATDNQGLYPRSLSALTPNYLQLIPTCPTAGTDTYSRSYCCNAQRKKYEFCCVGRNHPGLAASNEPLYNSQAGLIYHPSGTDAYEVTNTDTVTGVGQLWLFFVCWCFAAIWLYWAVSETWLTGCGIVLEGMAILGLILGWLSAPVGRISDPITGAFLWRLTLSLAFPAAGMWVAWRSHGRSSAWMAVALLLFLTPVIGWSFASINVVLGLAWAIPTLVLPGRLSAWRTLKP